MKTTYLIITFFLSINLCSNAQSVARARKMGDDILLSTTSEHHLQRHSGDSIRIQYIGCGGFLIRYGNEGVLLDPYFSNANIRKNPFQTLQSDTVLIDSFFVQNFKMTRDTEGVIQTVLIAHAHHDHLADLPSLLKRNLLTEKITLIGSQTMSNLIQSFGLPIDAKRQIICFDTLFDKKNPPPPDNIGSYDKYISPNRRLKITPIKTEHAPHILRMKLPFIGGEVENIPKTPPQTSSDFKEGVNYNFMIDFLGTDSSIVFRIFSNAGAGANAPIGFPPPSVLDEKKVDMLLVCGANYDQVKGYPEQLVAFLKPEKIFVAHWEDFFTPIPELLKKPRVVPLTNIPEFLKILKQAMVENGIDPYPIIVQPLTAVWIKF